MRIAVDAMGGDYAPKEIIEGALLARSQYGIEVLLVGDRHVISAYLLQHHPQIASQIEIVPAEGQIDMHEEPLDGLRRKPKSSIAVSMNLVKKKQADAVISAGHTGAAMAAALLRLGRLPGIDRPAIGALLPTQIPHKPVLVLDVGANIDCRPKFLEQFAMMGLLYSHYALGVAEPKLGLLNIGEEPSKGNDLAVRVHQSLYDHPNISFAGNAEGRDVMKGEFDVIVCDGFVGNVLLKFAEGLGQVLIKVLRDELTTDWRAMLGAWLLKPNLKRIKARLDADEYGGALLLGVAGICVISHGSSNAQSIANGIRVAKDAVDNNVLERIRTQIEAKTSVPAVDVPQE
ncbi:phosphate:acyl-(acyl carrier protein) acyltransferase [Thalassoporum mexicanum PCC 7367]|uniref:phosphate acyltransferase PlsX n=1 Tax=Thalassoporum mexicanum TaxID=3457544 RepID=UPI00029FE4A9|nr:phosphate acyltransferase PlsX [Pseudanabaena sp. PCC 7367]AFY71070.1 phosphate:acyl-(acyl carrier protein) acyltransferase [Pseudanabaena sp. PCC 7367]